VVFAQPDNGKKPPRALRCLRRKNTHTMTQRHDDTK